MNIQNILSEWPGMILNWALTSGSKIVILLIVALIIYKASRPIITKIVRHAVKPDDRMGPHEEEKRENTLIQIFSIITKIGVVLFLGLTIMSEFGVDIAPLIAGAGILGLAIGFGAQSLVKDIITGLFIILENQYRVGDGVTIAGIGGSVEDIGLRITTLRDLDGTVHYVPHGEIKTVSNKAKGFGRVNLNIGVAYESDLDKVREVIDNVGQDLAEDPDFKDLIIDAPKFLRVDSFGASEIVIKVLGETLPLKQWEVAGEYRLRLKKAFDKEGIDIPFPQMVLRQK